MKKSERIVADFIELVKDGRMEPGDKLPTHRDLAFEYQCSVGTASRAYAELERRGYCYGRVGQGTFVYGTPGDDAATHLIYNRTRESCRMIAVPARIAAGTLVVSSASAELLRLRAGTPVRAVALQG